MTAVGCGGLCTNRKSTDCWPVTVVQSTKFDQSACCKWAGYVSISQAWEPSAADFGFGSPGSQGRIPHHSWISRTMIALLLASLEGTFFGLTLSFLSLFLIMLVLVQRGKGGGLTGALGGPGGQSAFGTKAGDMFTRITAIGALIWISLCGASVFVLGNGRTKVDTSEPPAVESLESVENADVITTPENEESTSDAASSDAAAPDAASSDAAASSDTSSSDAAAPAGEVSSDAELGAPAPPADTPSGN